MRLRLIAAAAIATTTAGIASAQAPMASPCPTGTRTAVIRHDTIKPGQMAAFEKAVADHAAWYANHHDASTVRLLRMWVPSAKGPALSTVEAGTITYRSPTSRPEHDAAWNAFVAEYKASSVIKDEMAVCLPTGSN